MSQEPETNNQPTIEKLSIDNPSDFRFHAAFLAYSETWDRTSSSETRTQLNAIITSLSKNEIDTETFYMRLGQYRGGGGQEGYYGKARIETSRKKDWRKREAKSARESRHRR